MSTSGTKKKEKEKEKNTMHILKHVCEVVRAPGMGLQHMSAGVEGCAIEGSRVHAGRGVQQQRAPNERKSQRGERKWWRLAVYSTLC